MSVQMIKTIIYIPRQLKATADYINKNNPYANTSPEEIMKVVHKVLNKPDVHKVGTKGWYCCISNNGKDEVLLNFSVDPAIGCKEYIIAEVIL